MIREINSSVIDEWWCFELCREEIEEFAAELFELGCAGFELLSNERGRCYFNVDGTHIQSLAERICALGFVIVSHAQVQQKNWVQQSNELITPIQIGSFRIEPYLEGSLTPTVSAEPNVIRILPGMGFGTGHHATTRFMVELMERQAREGLAPQRVLDFGTGSGILAFVGARLFSAPIIAIDNDPAALENARENAGLNHLEDRISFSESGVDQVGECDLIVANLYAEVLCEYASAIKRALIPNHGVLIMSGIMSERLPLIREKFSAPEWIEVESMSDGNWEALVVRAAVL